jgi:hypothetical protein
VSGKGRYDIVSEGEAAAIGRALLAKIRGEPLSVSEQALLARARSNAPEDERAPGPVIDVSETLAVFERGEDAEVRLTWRSYRGSSPFLDIRRWERAPGEDTLKPTRQGVTIRTKEIGRMLTAIVQAMRKFGGVSDARVAEDE